MDVSRVGESERGRAPLPDVADNAVLSSGTYQLQKAAHAVQLARSQPIKGHRPLWRSRRWRRPLRTARKKQPPTPEYTE